MKTVWFDGRRALPRAVNLGVEMDNGVEQVQFVLPHLAEGQVEALYWQAAEADAADAVLLENGVWTITNAVTQHPGDATCTITISNGENLLWHSEPFRARVYGLPDVEGTVLRLYPSAILAGIEAAANARAAQSAAETAAASILDAAAQLAGQESANAASISALNTALNAARREISSLGAAEVVNAGNIVSLQTQITAAREQIAALEASGSSVSLSASYDAANKTLTLAGSASGGGESSGGQTPPAPSYDYVAEASASNFSEAYDVLFTSRKSFSDKLTLYLLASKEKPAFEANQLVMAAASNTNTNTSSMYARFARYGGGKYTFSHDYPSYDCAMAAGDGFTKLAFNDASFAESPDSACTTVTVSAACVTAENLKQAVFGTSYDDGGLYMARLVKDVSGGIPDRQVMLVFYAHSNVSDTNQIGFAVRRNGNGDYLTISFSSSYDAVLSVGDQFAVRRLFV